jgi:hypothetical protein
MCVYIYACIYIHTFANPYLFNPIACTLEEDAPGFLLFECQINSLLNHSQGSTPLFLRYVFNLNVYTYLYMYLHMYMYVYKYKDIFLKVGVHHEYIFIYIYIYIYIHKLPFKPLPRKHSLVFKVRH